MVATVELPEVEVIVDGDAELKAAPEIAEQDEFEFVVDTQKVT